jgi:hypothetical protein
VLSVGGGGRCASQPVKPRATILTCVTPMGLRFEGALVEQALHAALGVAPHRLHDGRRPAARQIAGDLLPGEAKLGDCEKAKDGSRVTSRA